MNGFVAVDDRLDPMRVAIVGVAILLGMFALGLGLALENVTTTPQAISDAGAG